MFPNLPKKTNYSSIIKMDKKRENRNKNRELVASKRMKVYDFNKVKNIDDITALPKKFLSNKIKTKTYYSYIGLTKYKFTFEYDASSALIYSYISHIINSTWYYRQNSRTFARQTCSLTTLSNNTELSTNNAESLKRVGIKVPKNTSNIIESSEDYKQNFYLIMHMIHTICRYNKVYKTPRDFKILNFNLLTNECVLFSEDNTMVWFNEPLIRKYLETVSNKISVKLDEKLMNTKQQRKFEQLNYRFTHIDSDCSKILLKLFCIADHAATHLIEDHQFKQNQLATDYIFHERFGTVGFTLHSMIRASPMRENKLLKNLFNLDNNTSCSNVQQPSSSNLYSSDLESIFNTKDLVLF